MMEWPHFLHASVASGGRSPEMKTLVLQALQVTIFKGALMSSEQALIVPVANFNPTCFCQAEMRVKHSFHRHFHACAPG
ncbi:MAG TPA: hypothetical protein VK327_05705 [Candidatus Paceibacterota bacterium]|nr:hypothetical protein [Candidatus Paceibacterota bacterium]